jgi:two-component system chemotaxis response regulator CheB
VTQAAAPRADATGVRVLVVEASEPVRAFLADRLAADPAVRVIQAVGHAKAALEALRKQRPDVVLMGDDPRGFDGFETTRQIMETQPVPIVLCAVPACGADHAFRSLEAGAVACIEKPDPAAPPAQLERAVAHMLQTVKLMAEVKVVRRWGANRRLDAAPRLASARAGHLRVVGIGASTGGPLVLQTILANLPPGFRLPLLVVQHIAPGFLAGMADWLRQTSGMKVQVAAYGLMPQPDHVYLAPDDFHMGVGADGRIVLSRSAPMDGLRPSVSFLFRTLAEVHGPAAVGVLLTGMGKDGAAELRAMKDRGATTIVQDSATSVVHGMPGEAIALRAATHVLPADRIADMLAALATRAVRPDMDSEQ